MNQGYAALTSRHGDAPPEPAGALLDRFIAGDGLSVVFQPICNLLTGDVIGYEVLGRFTQEMALAAGYSLEGPAALLDFAHAHGRLVALDRRLRSIAIEAIARRHATGGAMFFLNIDPRAFEDRSFTGGFTRRLVADHHLSPARFVLELTESGAALDGDGLVRMVHHYRSQGFCIALDDIGAGYASLTALVRLRPQFIKLDKELVQGLSDDPLRMNLVRALMDFGRRSDTRVIAEGIEDEADLIALLKAGVVLGQGYLLGRPARDALPPPESTRTLLREIANKIERVRFRPARTVSVGTLATCHPSVTPDMSCAEVDRLLRQDPSRMGFPVVNNKDGRTAGLVMRSSFLAQTSGAFGFALHSKRPVGDLMDEAPLRVDESAGIDHVSRLATHRDESRIYDLILIERDGRYAGIATVHSLLHATTELDIEHARYASPLTGLPGNVVIEHEIRRMLDAAHRDEPACVVYADLDHFKAFNDVYGFAAGDEMIRLVALVLDRAFSRWASGFFLGHLGGDDFVVITSGTLRAEEACAEAAGLFDELVRLQYRPEDVARGGIETADRRGVRTFFPIVTLSIALVSTADLSQFEVHEVARVAAELKHRAKAEGRTGPPASRWVRERRPPASGPTTTRSAGTGSTPPASRTGS